MTILIFNDKWYVILIFHIFTLLIYLTADSIRLDSYLRVSISVWLRDTLQLTDTL